MNAGTKIFLVLLRVAIGWHFFYEGIYKISSERAGAQPFTAEFYLRGAKGNWRRRENPGLAPTGR